MKKIKLSSSKPGRALHWFRRDLRVSDNTALYRASIFAREANDSELLSIFIISPDEWKRHSDAPIKIDLWMRSLKELQIELKKYNIPLIIKTANKESDIPSLISRTCEELQIDTVFINKEYEVDEQKRDNLVSDALVEASIKVLIFDDWCVAPPNSVIAKSSGRTSTVFTPFKKRWFSVLNDNKHFMRVLPNPIKNPENRLDSSLFDDVVPPFVKGFELDPEYKQRAIKLYPAGEQIAISRLDEFIKLRISNYKTARDIPSVPGTSILSPYLNGGIISSRTCLQRAFSLNHNKFESGNIGIDTWINELCWRDFYTHILFAFPHVSKSKPFNRKYDDLQWNDNYELLDKWKQGKTGYPIVDAAMRQLNTIGWMHNRLRMIVSSFLVKDLLQNWMDGEKYFMEKLIDGNLASNNGGWQWSASTGTDSQPYFRIFNPSSQSLKFDKDGAFIKKYCPELKDMSAKYIHEPWKHFSKAQLEQIGYCAPIVDHAEARVIAIALFKNTMEAAKLQGK